MLPLVFTPYLRPQVWGGRALAEAFGKRLPPVGDFGESWEISGQAHHVSAVAEGPFAGANLNELCVDYRAELFGLNHPRRAAFPFLVKLLDCERLLSVQVHPNDATAAKLLGEPNGKTEAWVVLQAGPDAVIYAGLKKGVTPSSLRRHLDEDTVQECLHSFKPQVGDCLFVPAGLVHAVGGGVVMAEVQQTSDATFRLFDWNRVDPRTGVKRPLHVEESLASIDFALGPRAPEPRQPLDAAPPGVSGERFVHCPYFRLDGFEFASERIVEAFLPCPPGELTIWMAASGRLRLEGHDYVREFSAGETVLVPASAPPLAWRVADPSKPAGLLRIRLPTT
jgi:mannose-6-phosphate isomerase